MNEVEKRRLQLLQNTRKVYSEKNNSPAVHPRYRVSYNSIYNEESIEGTNLKSTFGIRLVIAILILMMFYTMDNQSMKYHNINSKSVVKEIQRNLFG